MRTRLGQNKLLAKGLEDIEAKKDCTDEDRQQFNRPTAKNSKVVQLFVMEFIFS